MLHLIQRNRLGKNIINTGEQNLNWREVFKASEDSLTSSVFSLLLYLPIELFWRILYNACYNPSLPVESGKILSFEFWPHWDCTETENNLYIEPDLFIRFNNFNLIIEAKRNDYQPQQNSTQWITQLKGYKNEFKDNSKLVYYIALSGIVRGSEEPELIEETIINKCRWHRILTETKTVAKIIHHGKGIINNTDSIINIIEDIIRAFNVHGFRTGELLCSISNNYIISSQSIDKLSTTG
jgi:hypothetical protein